MKADPTTPTLGAVYDAQGIALITVDGVALTPAALQALLHPDAQTRTVEHARTLLAAAEAERDGWRQAARDLAAAYLAIEAAADATTAERNHWIAVCAAVLGDLTDATPEDLPAPGADRQALRGALQGVVAIREQLRAALGSA